MADIYRAVFEERQISIANNLHLDPKRNKTIRRLLDKGVIKTGLVSELIGIDVNSRGARVVSSIIEDNALDVYEKFLEIWREVNNAAASEFEQLLNQRLDRAGLTRPVTVEQVPARIDKADIYRDIFQEKQKTISNNLPLDPNRDDTIKRLLVDGVIDDKLRDVLIGLGVNLRGEKVVKHIIAINNLDVYEKFLAIWHDVKQEAASNFEKQLDELLEGFNESRHIVVNKSPLTTKDNQQVLFKEL